MDNIQLFVNHSNKQLKGRKKPQQTQQTWVQNPAKYDFTSTQVLWTLGNEAPWAFSSVPSDIGEYGSPTMQYSKNECKRAKNISSTSNFGVPVVPISRIKSEPGWAQGNMEKKKKAGIWGSDPWCDSDMPMILSVSSIQHKRRKWGRKIKCLLSDTAAPWEMGWY